MGRVTPQSHDLWRAESEQPAQMRKGDMKGESRPAARTAGPGGGAGGAPGIPAAR